LWHRLLFAGVSTSRLPATMPPILRHLSISLTLFDCCVPPIAGAAQHPWKLPRGPQWHPLLLVRASGVVCCHRRGGMREQHRPAGVQHFDGQVLAAALLMGLLTSIWALAVASSMSGPNSPPNLTTTAALMALSMALLTGIWVLAAASLTGSLTGIWSPPKSTPN
jgi:hypothetical protein